MNNTAIKFAPAESGEKRIEMVLRDEVADIRLSSWIEGLGWCGEKTLSVDSDQLDELHRLISAARVRIRSERKNAGEAGAAPAKLLAFPQMA